MDPHLGRPGGKGEIPIGSDVFLCVFAVLRENRCRQLKTPCSRKDKVAKKKKQEHAHIVSISATHVGRFSSRAVLCRRHGADPGRDIRNGDGFI
jgi:hypothetical protein